MTSDIVLISFFDTYSFIMFLRSTSMLHQKNFFLIFGQYLTHGKFNSEHFMRSNFLALDRYSRRYSEKTKKSAARDFCFASNRKSSPTIILKTQGSYYAGDNVSVDKCSTFLGNIVKFRPFLALTPRLNVNIQYYPQSTLLSTSKRLCFLVKFRYIVIFSIFSCIRREIYMMALFDGDKKNFYITPSA